MYKILNSDIEGLTTKMHGYQRRSAALMLQREAQPSQIIDPRLRPIIDQKGATWYCDLDAGTCFREPRKYEAAKGGICAETMGLGKTLICLALILATRELSSQIPIEYSVGTVPVRQKTASLKDMAAATIGRTGTPWKSHFAAMEAEGYDFSQCLQAIKKHAGHYHLPGPAPRRQSRNPVAIPPRKIWLTTATIVVVPPNLVQQWRHEIRKHTVGLKVLVMNNSKVKLPLAKELAEFDIILFSKQRFDQEAKDGIDDQGRRRTTTNSVCRCPYIGSTRERDCTCFRDEDAYRSPLKDLHFKRLITDEGHFFGSASSSSKTEAVTVVEFLPLSSRWIVSGTPTTGLYGMEVVLSSEGSSMSNTPVQADVDESTQLIRGIFDAKLLELRDSSDTAFETSSEQEMAFYKQERKDLEKLGNIATVYLKARPWANTAESNDLASWSQHVMQRRHGSKSHGNMECLKSTLEGMIIRHRPEDVSIDVTLPPLHQNVVYLEGSYQDKLSLNIFSMMIVANAVTSERKDKDYFFHSKQRKALQELVSNLRQASFFWSGFTEEMVQTTINNAKNFLEKREVPVTAEDEFLLQNAIKNGEVVLANMIHKKVSEWHEMPMYVQNEWSEDTRAAWALDGDRRNPTLMGATMVHGLHEHVSKELWRDNLMDGLIEAGNTAWTAANLARQPPSTPRKKSNTDPKFIKKSVEQAPPPTLAGGVSVGDGSTPKKRSRPIGTAKPVAIWLDRDSIDTSDTQELPDEHEIATKPKSALKNSKKLEVTGTLDSKSPLASTMIVSTSSTKLSYLMDRIITYQSEEKIIVFYEADNVAYYIAQALEILGIEHLIYAKSLTSSRRADYVVTFNQSETFRVLLMDVTQAAFGLDMSSASRVYFVNPVFSPQVEAQAVKRAHRIGQIKPVYVETLVLKGSMEEVMMERRKDMTTEEHNKCKSVLDDETMFDWIRNVGFLPLPCDEAPGPDQMAKLEIPQLVFARGITRIRDPDAGLVLDSLRPTAKGKKRAQVSFLDDSVDVVDNAKPKKRLAFLIPESDSYFKPTSSDDEKEQREIDQEAKRQSKRQTKKRESVTFEENVHRGNNNSMLMNITGLGSMNDPFQIGESPSLSRQIFESEGNNFQHSSMRPQSPGPPSSLRYRYSPHIWHRSSARQPMNASFGSLAGQPFRSHLSHIDPSITQDFMSDPPPTYLAQLHTALDPCSMSETPSPSFSRQPLPSSSFNTGSNLIDDNDEIEFSTQRRRIKHPGPQMLRFKAPRDESRNPSLISTSTSPTAGYLTSSPSLTPDSSYGLSLAAAAVEVVSPTKAQRARLDSRGTKSLLVKLKICRASFKVRELQERSGSSLTDMRAAGAVASGGERMDAGVPEA